MGGSRRRNPVCRSNAVTAPRDAGMLHDPLRAEPLRPTGFVAFNLGAILYIYRHILTGWAYDNKTPPGRTWADLASSEYEVLIAAGGAGPWHGAEARLGAGRGCGRPARKPLAGIGESPGQRAVLTPCDHHEPTCVIYLSAHINCLAHTRPSIRWGARPTEPHRRPPWPCRGRRCA